MRSGAFLALPCALLLSLAPVAPFGAPQARAASFNCARASTDTERAICGDATLSALDSQLGAAYAARTGADQELKQLQRGWLKARDEGCGKDRPCLRRMISAELAWMRTASPMTSRLPKREGECGLSSIARKGSRLDGDPQSGSAVSEADGAMQVSYDVIPAIQKAEVGDAAIVCLISLPSDCPPGDDRGKVYAVADLRTLKAWSAPDAEHLCGGA